MHNLHSPSEINPAGQKRMAHTTVALFAFFATIALWKMVFSDLVL